MKKLNGCFPLLSFLLTSAILFFSLSTPARAQDDGARAYWKAREGTHVVSFQYLPVHGHHLFRVKTTRSFPHLSGSWSSFCSSLCL